MNTSTVQLRVIADNPHPRFSVRPRRLSHDTAPFILPKIDVFSGKRGDSPHWKFECEMLGLTSKQRDLAWKIALKDADRRQTYMEAINRLFLLWQAVEQALEWERREVLAILMDHYPKAARRILRTYRRA